MRVTFIDPFGRNYDIDSENITIIASWVADMIPQIMTQDTRMEWRFRVWVGNDKEAKMVGSPYMRDEFLSEDGLRKLENLFRRTRENYYKKEKKDGGKTLLCGSRIPQFMAESRFPIT